ncbi:MAG: MBL fold metallo-hydrolase [Candidatus Hodarchaeota archaeon]
MFKLCVLESSSKGNATYVRIDDTCFLIDAGISTRKIEHSLKEIGENIAELTNIIITHEHNDHIKGIKTLSKRFQCKFWMTFEVYQKIRKKTGAIDADFIDIGQPFYFNEIEIIPYEIIHDAINPVAFLISRKEVPLIGYINDCGFPTPFLLDGFRKVKILIVEANHSFDLLIRSSYPESLKYRILGSKGHLSNWQTGEFISITTPQIVILSHISEQNNDPNMALAEIEFILENNKNLDTPFFVIVPPNKRSALIQASKI